MIITNLSQANHVKERAVRIGKPIPLVGIISEPSEFDPERPAVLLFNSGVMHHIGSCRLSVKLARAFASVGNLAIRFDFSGIGDSEPRRGTLSFEESAPKEAAEVMDYLQRKRGIKKFVLYGLCSGADAAFETALADERVIGFAQIDPYCYRTPRYHFNYYASRFFVLEHWISSAKRISRKINGAGDSKSPAEVAGIDEAYFEVPTYVRVFPPREQVANGLRKLVDRRVTNCVFVTGSEPDYNYEAQYVDSFKEISFGGLLECTYLVESNHIVTDPRHQSLVVDSMSKWLKGLSDTVIGAESAAEKAA